MAVSNRLSFPTKAEARTWALQQRHALGPAESRAWSQRIVERLIASECYRAADTLLTYVGALPGELDTRPLIEAALADRKTVFVPLAGPEGRMNWSRLMQLADLEPTRRGLLEPREDAHAIATPSTGLCIVPGVCFRRDGHRIGYGAGYYDRFLEHFGGVAVALTPAAFYGVGFPVEPHDQPVSAILTEDETHLMDRATCG